MGSNALAFKNWAVSENVVVTSPLEQFRDRRIGIDAEDYLHSLLFAGNREPLLPALGGQPFTLKKRVGEDLEGFRAAGIEPVFVFNGLDLACKDRISILNEGKKASTILNDAWNIYDQGKGEEAVNAFGRACIYKSYHISRSLRTHLHREGAQTQTAPYTAAAQLAYMEREGLIDGIHGCASSLVFGSDRVIFNFDWDKKQAVWIALQKCLSKLELTREQFTTTCLLSGSSILPVFPELDADTITVPKMQAARGLLKTVNYDIDSLLRQKDPTYHDLFYQARFALKHPVILKSSGEVEPLNWKSGPSDVHAFTGQRLPEEIYYYLARGVAGPRVLNWRTRMEVLETPPLDGGNSPAYKDLVQKKLRPLRAQSLGLMTQSLNRYYQKHDVDLACWWNEQNKIPLAVPDKAEPTKAADSWNVKAEQMPQSSVANAENFSLVYAITSLSNDSEAKATVTPRNAGSTVHMRDLNEARANIVWRFLQDRGYLNADHTLSVWGKALKAALEQALSNGAMSDSRTRTEMEEAIFMAFELLRLDVLDKKQMFPMPPYSGAPIRGSDNDKSNTTLVSRVACLGTLQHSAIGYTGPLSRHLLAYQQTASAVRGALRDLLEMHACHMLLSGTVDRSLHGVQLTELGTSLPLINEPDLGLALVVKSHLDELSQPADKRQDITAWFAHAEDISGDLEKAWRLWDAVNAGVQAAESSIMNSDMKKTFRVADEWLKQKLERANAPNGTA
ncbi:hypothetical protein LTR37_014419 [Vermiconidia calcicola]|uniref:Uncharacterized protein n=1 Tax=Vermiconidia calcicola TaxID=1690605 RepID=A0ACC3MTL2_9PEZI|nr:hypothetical protein LTR37_014419 [Vermiconidia calcicola]